VKVIDVKLVGKAKKKSDVIEAIDFSWRTYVEKVREGVFMVPFKGNYAASVEGDSVLVEGYSGLLVIDKLYHNRKTYKLMEPVRYYPFRIYGVYDSRGRFECFVSRPEIGFHYLGMVGHGHSICTGEVQYANPGSLELLKEASSKIVGAFRVINMDSLGTVLLPDDYKELKEIFSNKEEPPDTKVRKLLDKGLIEQIL
jgi:hypothetical protein